MNLDSEIVFKEVGLFKSGHCVFDKMNLSLQCGLWHSVLGRSGIGKTCLLRLLAMLETPDSGKIESANGASLSGQIAYMSQEDGLLPWLTVLQNVQLGARLRGQADKNSQARAYDLLDKVNLRQWSSALPNTLSGGMRQRVSLARTLFEARSVVLMDEPFSRLDAITRDELQTLSYDLLNGKTVVLVTHDPGEALRMSHIVHVLQPLVSKQGTEASSLVLGGSPLRSVENSDVLSGIPMLWKYLKSTKHA